MKTILDVVSQYHLLKHPFYQDWMAGKLSREILQDYASQYYSHVEAFPRYVSAIHSLCDDATDRRQMLENLADEEGLTHGVSHPELWTRFAEGMGVKREELQSSNGRAAIQKVTDTFFRLTRSSFHEGLGALYAYESQIPEIACSKIEGLRANYGVNDERTLSFFEVHREADVHHREAVSGILDKLPQDKKEAATRAAEEASKALWDFLTDVQEHDARRTA